MVRRASLDDALGHGEEPEPTTPTSGKPEPSFAPGDASRAPATHPYTVQAVADRYKLTVVLEEDEHEQLETITEAVLADVRPRRVGKGWRTKVIRALLAEAMAGDRADPAVVRRIADRLRE